MVKVGRLVAGLFAFTVGIAVTATGGDVLPMKQTRELAVLVTGLFLAGAGAVALVASAFRAAGRRRSSSDGFDSAVRTPGDRVDARLASTAGDEAGARREVRDRFEAAAVAALVRERRCSPERARELLAEGTWTDDQTAAAYFTGEAPGSPLWAWLRAVVRGEPVEQRRAERASEILFGGEER